MGKSAMGLLVNVRVTRYGDLDVVLFGMTGRSPIPVGSVFWASAQRESRVARKEGLDATSRAWRTIRDVLRRALVDRDGPRENWAWFPPVRGGSR